MLTFKSREDLSKLDPHNPAYPIIEDFVQRLCVDHPKESFTYDAQADGWVNLVEPKDMGRFITEIWEDRTLLDVPWEGVMYKENHYIGIFLADNQKGFIFVIPDEDWLTDELRDILEDNLDN